MDVKWKGDIAVFVHLSRLWHWLQKFACLHNKVRTTHPITTKLGSYIPRSDAYYLIKFWRKFDANFGDKFILKIVYVFSRPNALLHIYLWTIGLIDMKLNGSPSVGHCISDMTLTFDLTHDFDREIFKFKFLNLRNCWSDGCEMKRRHSS